MVTREQLPSSKWLLRYAARRLFVSSLTGFSAGIILTSFAGHALPGTAASWWGILAVAAVLLTARRDTILMLNGFKPLYLETVEESETSSTIQDIRFDEVTAVVWHEFLAYVEIRGPGRQRVLFACDTQETAGYFLWHVARRVRDCGGDTQVVPPFSMRLREMLPLAIIATWVLASICVIIPLISKPQIGGALFVVYVVVFWKMGERIGNLFKSAWCFEQTETEISYCTLFRTVRIDRGDFRHASFNLIPGSVFWRLAYFIPFPMRNTAVCVPASCAWLNCGCIPQDIIEQGEQERAGSDDLESPVPEVLQSSLSAENLAVPRTEASATPSAARSSRSLAPVNAQRSGKEDEIASPPLPGEEAFGFTDVAHLIAPSRSSRILSVLFALPLIALGLPFLVIAASSGNAAILLASLAFGLPTLSIALVFLDRGLRGYRFVVEFSAVGLSYPYRRNAPCLRFSDIRRIDHQPLFKRLRISGTPNTPVIYLRSNMPDTQAVFREIVNRVPIDAHIFPTSRNRRTWSRIIIPILISTWCFAVLANMYAQLIDGARRSVVVGGSLALFGALAFRAFFYRKTGLQSISVRDGMLVFHYPNREEATSLNDVYLVSLGADLNCDHSYMNLTIHYQDGSGLVVWPFGQDRFGLFVYLRRELCEWLERRRAMNVVPESESR